MVEQFALALKSLRIILKKYFSVRIKFEEITSKYINSFFKYNPPNKQTNKQTNNKNYILYIKTPGILMPIRLLLEKYG